jgi:peptidyl-tRNA hydrolase
MKKSPLILSAFNTLLLLLLVTASSSLLAAEQTIMLDGREVLLREDGTWSYQSNDRYADTKDGKRVRLKEDGSWEYAGNTALTTTNQVRTEDLDMKLEKVVVETYKKKSQKNVSVKTQTVFYVQLKASAQAKKITRIDEGDMSLVEVKDNNGKSYQLVSMKAGLTQLEPDTVTTLAVRVKKSPSIFDDVKSMEIIFSSGIFGNKTPVTLSQKTTDFQQIKVDGFEE